MRATSALLLTLFGWPATPAEDAGFALMVDDDLFTGPGRDRDYTGGTAITFSGAHTRDYWFSPDPLLHRIDGAVGLHSSAADSRHHALALGVLAFTPQNVAASQPLFDDRPYASLAFIGSGRRYVSATQEVAYNSSLIVGLLGLKAVGEGHRAIHRITSSDPLHGYAHQISAGGEPTLRYNVARQALLARCIVNCDLKWTVAASLGTVTEGSIALSGRWGRIRSPWWGFAPEQNMYVQEIQPLVWTGNFEAFFTAGVRLRARAYNVFLQGQFRDSEVRHSSGDLNALLGDAWLGAAMRMPAGFEVRYLARWGTPELRGVHGARNILWGSVEFARPL